MKKNKLLYILLFILLVLLISLCFSNKNIRYWISKFIWNLKNNENIEQTNNNENLSGKLDNLNGNESGTNNENIQQIKDNENLSGKLNNPNENESGTNNENIEQINNNSWSETTSNFENNINNEKIELIEYENKNFKFKLNIPDNRRFKDNDKWFNIILFTPENDKINENLWIKIQELQIKQDAESYLKTTINELKNLYTNLTQEKIKDTNTNNWKSIIYEFFDEWLSLKAQQTVFILNNKAYVFTYTATKYTFNEYIDTVNQIIDSFSLLN